MVDQRCRESEGKAKIEGYMSTSDEEAHQCNCTCTCLFDGHMFYDMFYFYS